MVASEVVGRRPSAVAARWWSGVAASGGPRYRLPTADCRRPTGDRRRVPIVGVEAQEDLLQARLVRDEIGRVVARRDLQDVAQITLDGQAQEVPFVGRRRL